MLGCFGKKKKNTIPSSTDMLTNVVSGKNILDQPSLMDKLKFKMFNMMIQTNGTPESQGQYSFAKKMIKNTFPQATVKKQVLPNQTGNMLNVFMDGEKIHNGKSDGDIRQNPKGFMEKIGKGLASGLNLPF